MPLGASKGKALANVPSDYLIYLRSQPGWDKTSPLGVYIENNADVLNIQSKYDKAKDKYLKR